MSQFGQYGQYGGGEGGPRQRRNRFPRFGRRKLVMPEQPLEYKNIEYLSKLVSPQGKIWSRKRTGFSGQDQRKLALAVKRARLLALMPFVAVKG